MATFLKGRSMLNRFVFRQNYPRTVFCSFTNNAEDGLVSKGKEEKVVYDLEDSQCGLIAGIPEEQLKSRKVRIFSPAQNAMQSGSFNTRLWSLEFNTQDRWENPLMGWGSSGDPLSNTSLEFGSREEALRYVERQGWDYEVDEKQEFQMRDKSYGANFAWSKRTRVSTK